MPHHQETGKYTKQCTGKQLQQYENTIFIENITIQKINWAAAISQCSQRATGQLFPPAAATAPAKRQFLDTKKAAPKLMEAARGEQGMPKKHQ